MIDRHLKQIVLRHVFCFYFIMDFFLIGPNHNRFVTVPSSDLLEQLQNWKKEKELQK